MSTWNVTTSNIIKSGTNASITECVCYCQSGTFASYTYQNTVLPLIGVVGQKTLAMRLKVVPTRKVKNVSFSMNYASKTSFPHANIKLYAGVRTAYPSYETKGTELAISASSGTINIDLTLAEKTADAFYVYVWGYIVSNDGAEHDARINSVSSLVCDPACPALFPRVGDHYKETDTLYVKVNGAWKEVETMYVKVNGAWKEVTS